MCIAQFKEHLAVCTIERNEGVDLNACMPQQEIFYMIGYKQIVIRIAVVAAVGFERCKVNLGNGSHDYLLCPCVRWHC